MHKSSAGRRLFGTCVCCAQFAATSVSRRTFIAGGAAAGLAVAGGLAPKAFAQAKPHRIECTTTWCRRPGSTP
jgi:hypothetical protein